MLIDYFIQKPNHKVTQLSREMDLQQDLKKQHQRAFTHRLKRFTVTKVGIASAFSAGVGYQALKSDGKSGKLNQLSKFTWLLRLI